MVILSCGTICDDLERYRSGHNGTDSKSDGASAHVGSNPTLSDLINDGSVPDEDDEHDEAMTWSGPGTQ